MCHCTRRNWTWACARLSEANKVTALGRLRPPLGWFTARFGTASAARRLEVHHSRLEENEILLSG